MNNDGIVITHGIYCDGPRSYCCILLVVALITPTIMLVIRNCSDHKLYFQFSLDLHASHQKTQVLINFTFAHILTSDRSPESEITTVMVERYFDDG